MSVAACLRVLGADAPPEHLVLRALLKLFDMMWSSLVISRECQDEIWRLGGIDALAAVASDPALSPQVRGMAFTCLGTMAFNNSPVCTAQLHSPAVVAAITDAIHANPAADGVVLERCVYLASNLASCDPPKPPALMQSVLGAVLSVLANHSHGEEVLDAAICAVNKLLNDDDCLPEIANDPKLRSHLALLMRWQSSRSVVGELMPAHAALALSRIAQHTPHAGPFPTHLVTPRIARVVVTLLDCAVHGTAYPNSQSALYCSLNGISTSLASFAAVPENRPLLVAAGIVPLLQKGLRASDDHSSHSTRKLLEVVWFLSCG